MHRQVRHRFAACHGLCSSLLSCLLLHTSYSSLRACNCRRTRYSAARGEKVVAMVIVPAGLSRAASLYSLHQLTALEQVSPGGRYALCLMCLVLIVLCLLCNETGPRGERGETRRNEERDASDQGMTDAEQKGSRVTSPLRRGRAPMGRAGE